MGRIRRDIFAVSTAQHYVVIWDLHWQIIGCSQPRRGSDPRAALTEAIERLERDGWTPEGASEFGFAFMSRAEERRLVTITARDPFASTAQSFSPFERGHP